MGTGIADVGEQHKVIIMQMQRQEKKRLTRQKILMASYELFYTHGHENTSYGQIAKLADVGYGTVYAHFPTKEGMLIAQMNMLMEMQKTTLDSLSQNDRSDLEHALFLIDHSWGTISMLPQPLLAAYMAHRWGANKDDYIEGNALRDAMLKSIEGFFHKAQAKGELSPDIDIPKHMFMMDASYVKAVQVGRFCEEDRITAKAEFDAHVRYLLRLD